MLTMRSTARRLDERGLAMPMALVALLILSGLVVGFSTLSATEPTIAGNQLSSTQARALAEAGVERTLWALKNPADAKGIPSPLMRPAPAPFDGSRVVPVSAAGVGVGAFRVAVTTGTEGCPTSAERCIASAGWAPADRLRQAHRKILVTARNPQLLFKDPPAALSVRGDLHIGANAVVDSQGDTSCGKKVGTLTTGTTSVDSGTAVIRGAADGNDVANEVTDALRGPVPVDAHDIVTNVGSSSFDNVTFTDADVNFLRAYAKTHGTYLQGAVSFDRGRRMPNGLIFVDTVSGRNISAEGKSPATPGADFADVAIHGNPPTDADGVFNGWLFVNGSLSRMSIASSRVVGTPSSSNSVIARRARRTAAGRSSAHTITLATSES
jgi:hypothetical protein